VQALKGAAFNALCKRAFGGASSGSQVLIGRTLCVADNPVASSTQRH